MISNKALSEYQKLCEEENGHSPPNAEAMAQATALLSLFSAVFKPIKKVWLSEHQNSKLTAQSAISSQEIVTKEFIWMMPKRIYKNLISLAKKTYSP